MKPAISVVLPVFNRAWQLHRALESLHRQNYQNFEVIVCDDGSTEDIASLVKGFDGLLDIHLIQMVNWGGPAKPRNEGLKLSAGEWIAFLDSDDWWDSNRLSVISNYLNNLNDVVYHPLRVAREVISKKSREKRKVLGEPIRMDAYQQMMLLGNPIPTSAVVVRKDLLLLHQGMSEERGLISGEDFDCWLRLAKAGARFCFVNQCLGNYWIGSDAISAISPRQLEVQKLIYQRNAPNPTSNFFKKALGRQNYVLGSLYIKLEKPHLALGHLKVAYPLETLGLNIKRWVFIMLSLVKIARIKLSPSIYKGG